MQAQRLTPTSRAQRHTPPQSTILVTSCRSLTNVPTTHSLASVAPQSPPQRPCSHHQQLKRQRHSTVARTSADWWEDELEYDAITEQVLPKDIHVLVGADIDNALAHLKGRKLTTGFCSEQGRAGATAVWDALGQGGPPLFKKVRTREVLQQVEDASLPEATAQQAAEAFLSELCMQSWRVELDYGLEGADKAPTDQLLVVVGSTAAAARLIACVNGQQQQVVSSTYIRISTKGFNLDGLATSPLEGWRQLLPQVDWPAVSTTSTTA